jgi:hypothetical protein
MFVCWAHWCLVRCLYHLSNLKPSYNKPKRRNIYLFKKANWENIKEEIAKIGSTIINSTKFPEEKWTDLKDGINNAHDFIGSRSNRPQIKSLYYYVFLI